MKTINSFIELLDKYARIVVLNVQTEELDDVFAEGGPFSFKSLPVFLQAAGFEDYQVDFEALLKEMAGARFVNQLIDTGEASVILGFHNGEFYFIEVKDTLSEFTTVIQNLHIRLIVEEIVGTQLSSLVADVNRGNLALST